MFDRELHLDNQNNFQREKLLIESQKTASLRNLSFWSSPAWFRSPKHSTLSAVAIKEWVSYHRLSVAIKKETVVQIINSVKKVIPDSKLAKYGDYSYDINYEDMCCIDEDLNPKTNVLKTEKFTHARRYDFWASETETKIGDTSENDIHPVRNENNIKDLKRAIRSLGEWLKELNRVLIRVRKIANEAQLLDSWTETLLKFSLRFVCVLRSNENLAKLLNSDISFIIDYERLRKIPISKIELKSIPQPENTGDILLNNKSADDLWLKISSSQIRNIWKKDGKDPLVEINFLRSRYSKSSYFSRQTVEVSPDIPKSMETKLLGSLLDDINENFFQSGDTKLHNADKNYFPEAHGDWTKELFPHRMKNPTSEKDSAVPKSWNPTFKSQVTDIPVQLERGCSETVIMPSQFYKCVPPPTLAARFRLPYMHPQPRNRLLYVPPNDLVPHPPNQQIQHNVPVVPLPNVQTSTYVSQTQFSHICNAPQRKPVQSNETGQYNKIGFLRVPHHSESIKEPEKYSSKIGDNSCSEKVRPEKAAKGLIPEKSVHSNEEMQPFRNIPELPTSPFVQLSREYNIPFRIQQNIGNAIGSTSNQSPSVLSSPQLHMHESRMPLKVNYPITSIRLRTPLIKNMLPSANHYMRPQFTSKPRFLGPITINNIKRMQERLCGARKRQMQHYLKNLSHQNIENSDSFKNVSSNFNDESPGYEDKVEKWLESVNKYVQSGSFVNLEELSEFSSTEQFEFPRSELPELSSIKLPDFNNELEAGGKGDIEESEKRQIEHATEVSNMTLSSVEINTPSDLFNIINGKSHENESNILKIKKMKAKSKIIKKLEPLQDIVQKLKRTRKLRNKIKIIKMHFGGINSMNTNKLNFENFIKILRTKNSLIINCGQRRKKECPAFRQKHCLGIKSNKQCSTENKFDLHQVNLLINDMSKYNMLIRVNKEFNLFPSKRTKLRKLEPSFFKTEAIIRNKRSRWIASLNYFDSIIDELFFAAHGIEDILDENEDKMVNVEINGWTHFKVTIKTIMKNIISSLEAQNLN